MKMLICDSCRQRLPETMFVETTEENLCENCASGIWPDDDNYFPRTIDDIFRICIPNYPSEMLPSDPAELGRCIALAVMQLAQELTKDD